MPSGRSIVVIGSVNMDLVCRLARLPRAGETIMGADFVSIPGGKGANQAVAAAKLLGHDGEVHFVGRTGSDEFGRQLLAGLREHNVRTDHVTVTPGTASGVAMILVDRKGENSIIVAPGANARLSPKDIDAATPLIEQASIVVMQLEIPLPTVRHAIAIARRAGVFTILDPAPVPLDGIPRAILAVDLLTPNQQEAALLLSDRPKKSVQRKSIVDPKQVAADLVGRGPGRVVIKLGARGAMLVDRFGRIERGRPFKVKVEDTTAAGDAFTAALAVAEAEGRDHADALRFANAAGALTCTRLGAQPSLPARQAVERMLAKR
jgi:ribokinase